MECRQPDYPRSPNLPKPEYSIHYLLLTIAYRTLMDLIYLVLVAPLYFALLQSDEETLYGRTDRIPIKTLY